jgi:hypothetical protein
MHVFAQIFGGGQGVAFARNGMRAPPGFYFCNSCDELHEFEDDEEEDNYFEVSSRLSRVAFFSAAAAAVNFSCCACVSCVCLPTQVPHCF